MSHSRRRDFRARPPRPGHLACARHAVPPLHRPERRVAGSSEEEDGEKSWEGIPAPTVREGQGAPPWPGPTARKHTRRTHRADALRGGMSVCVLCALSLLRGGWRKNAERGERDRHAVAGTERTSGRSTGIFERVRARFAAVS